MRRAFGMGCLLVASACAAPPRACPRVADAPAPAAAAAVSVGQTFRVRSAVLGEERVINVYLPPDYEKSAARYPLLVALDGGVAEDFLHVAGNIDVATRNEVIAPRIVVGIENTERRRDLVPATTIAEEKKIAPHAGGTARFRQFLRDELLPEVARRYRVSESAGENSRAIVGESFAGLFVLETFLEAPDLFDTYIAIDPSVWWNGGAMVKSAKPAAGAKPKRVFIATGDYKETEDGVATFAAAMHDVTVAPFPDEHHSTIFPVAESRAYRTLFAKR